MQNVDNIIIYPLNYLKYSGKPEDKNSIQAI